MANNLDAVWKTVREIKLDDVRTAAFHPLSIALIGSEDELTWLQNCFAGNATRLTRLNGGTFAEQANTTQRSADLRRCADTLKLFEIPIPAETVKRINECTLVCMTPAASASLLQDSLVITPPIYTVGNLGEWESFRRQLLDTRADLHLSLGRNLPGLRPHILEYLIINTSCVNAEVAVVSAAFSGLLPPGIGPIYPSIAFGDTIILTKNQVMMAFRLAGACGLEIDIVPRRAEVISIIAAGFGWRSLCRAAVGMVPAVGIVLKGGIAYAGTYAAGMALSHYFATGSHLTHAEERLIYNKALDAGKAYVGQVVHRLTRKPSHFRRRGNRKTI